MKAPPLVYVGTGTDKKFVFPRLISWIESWKATSSGEIDLRLQAGITPSAVLPSVVQYSDEELDALIARASAAVIQGGAAGIMRMRRHGLKPVVVPRYGSRGEAVDDHQVTFVRWADAKGMVVHAETEDHLHALLDKVLLDAEAYRFTPEPPSTAQTVAHFSARVEKLLGH